MGALVVTSRGALMPVALIVVWPLLTMVTLAGDGYQNTRFAPGAAASGRDRCRDRARGVDGRPGSAPRRVATTPSGRGHDRRGGRAAAQVVGAWRFTEDFLVRFSADRTAIAALAAQVPRGDRVLSFGATMALRHGGWTVAEMSELAPDDVARIAASAARTWLVVPRGAPGDQWRATPVGATLASLLRHPATRLVDRAGTWELWSTQGG